MLRKKTTYEKKGIVRQITGSIFSSHQKDKSEDAKWRPRKNLFERLGGGDDDETVGDNAIAINRAFSLESETHEYRNGLLFDKKKAAFDQTTTKKRDLHGILIKPSSRDKPITRPAGERKKKGRKEVQGALYDPFGVDIFATQHHGKSDESVDDSLSRHTLSSKQTSSTRNTAFHTVSSDPSDFFSKQPATLTKSNVDLMTSMWADHPNLGGEENGIENINPRGKFHQFTIEEDKESTVVFPVIYPGDESLAVGSENDEILEEDSQYSLGVTSKGTQIQKDTPWRTNPKTTLKKDSEDSLFRLLPTSTDIDSVNVCEPLRERFEDSFFSEFKARVAGDSSIDLDKNSSSTTKRGIRRDPSQQFQSSHSLAYSESTYGDADDLSSAINSSKQSIQQQTTGRQQRIPLSQLNIEPRSRLYTGSSGRNGAIKNSMIKPDPVACWTAFPGRFEKRPDPKADENLAVVSSERFAEEEPSNASPKKVQRRNAVTSRMNGAGNETRMWERRTIPEDHSIGDDKDDDINDCDSESEYEYGLTRKPIFDERPIGIQSFPNGVITRSYSSSSSHSSRRASSHSSRRIESMPHKNENSAHSRTSRDKSSGSSDHHKYHYGISGDQHSRGSHGRSYNDRFLCSHGLPKSRCCHIVDDDVESLGNHSASSASFTKPLGLPNNAIMASMLFRRHHNIDTEVVEAKLKAKEQEYKPDRTRGDIPQAIQAPVETLSSVSSFSEDTAAQIDAWRKPTRDLLEHFARSRHTESDFKQRLHQQRYTATELFEA